VKGRCLTIMKKRKISLEKISTRPRDLSYTWVGHTSVLSYILLWVIWLCRVFSLLQWVKIIYRTTVKFLQRATVDKGSKRINVPPIVVELYYVFWGVFLSVIYLCGGRNIWYSILSGYFIFESFVWILYYAIFRRFYEENYKIHHVLEYFVVIILILPLQAIAYANVLDIEFMATLLGILGVSTVDNCALIGVFSVIYQAIVIGIIISSFPMENTKVAVRTEERPAKSIIIGCGDVVKKRLFPALKSDNVVSIYDIVTSDIQDESLKVNVLDCEEKIVSAIKEELSDDSIVWIATPSYAHIFYLEKLLKMKDNALIVVEKPITVLKSELENIKMIIEDTEKRKRIFFLSYYILEKALPLYYLVKNNSIYIKYLKMHNVSFCLANMGRMKSVYVKIYEGKDDRKWVKEYGGQECDTFLHNVLVASLFVGLPSSWDKIEWKKETDKIHLSARWNEVDICLEQAKNVEEEKCSRYAMIQYQRGTVKMDFETQTLTINNTELGEKGTISVRDEYKGKYAIQTDLVKRVYDKEVSCEEADGLYHQIECIEWLLESKNYDKADE